MTTQDLLREITNILAITYHLISNIIWLSSSSSSIL